MSSHEPCWCAQSLALAADLRMARARLAEIAKLVRERGAHSTYTDDLGVECCNQIEEILAEGWLP
jgi:hypothetical protein